jgi:hypothetical protein
MTRLEKGQKIILQIASYEQPHQLVAKTRDADGVVIWVRIHYGKRVISAWLHWVEHQHLIAAEVAHRQLRAARGLETPIAAALLPAATTYSPNTALLFTASLLTCRPHV